MKQKTEKNHQSISGLWDNSTQPVTLEIVVPERWEVDKVQMHITNPNETTEEEKQ